MLARTRSSASGARPDSSSPRSRPGTSHADRERARGVRHERGRRGDGGALRTARAKCGHCLTTSPGGVVCLRKGDQRSAHASRRLGGIGDLMAKVTVGLAVVSSADPDRVGAGTEALCPRSRRESRPSRWTSWFVDKQGRPVRGLAAADFTVFEEGQPQVVVGSKRCWMLAAPPERPRTPARSRGRLGNRRRPRATSPATLGRKRSDPSEPRLHHRRPWVSTSVPRSSVKQAIAPSLATEASPPTRSRSSPRAEDLSWNDRDGHGSRRPPRHSRPYLEAAEHRRHSFSVFARPLDQRRRLCGDRRHAWPWRAG